ncbi:MAG: hypothetical protein H6974_12875 [Gammaproteobacteria bacterium]|nr:hypothetical protein [Gammaproteobacteria bacterium]
MTIAKASRDLYLQCAFKFGFWAGDTPPTQFYDPVNFTKLEITGVTQETDDLISNMEGSWGEVLSSVNKPTEPAQLTAEANYMPPALFSLLIGADITELNQTTSAVTDEAITPAVDLWIPLANQWIEATGFVAETSGDVTITSDHYEVDYVNGLFKALDTTGATVAKVTYTKSDRTGEIYKGGKAKSEYVKLVGTATEKVTQKRGMLVIHKVNLSASSTFDPVTGGRIIGQFSGKMLTPSGETSPWTWVYSDLASNL